MRTKPYTVTPEVAYEMDHLNRPWRVRLEYRGPNDKVVNGWSEKWWEAEGDGFGNYTYNHGKIGGNGMNHPKEIDLPTFSKRSKEKISKGYMVAAGSLSETPKHPINTHADLPSPFQGIRVVESRHDGWHAFDKEGKLVTVLTEKGAKGLIDLSPLITLREGVVQH